ncbi:MAG TPA: adenylate/guanylate cyclase domain-containing protein [Pyrinomonadaceae bacterium]|nr:adenylate/guanylate cyclase domain-containing protein [Pyrinomonadaceae bacterium]
MSDTTPDNNNVLSDNNEPVAQRNTQANLERLLSDMIEQPERREEIARSIETIFAQEKAVLVLDMSGFSRTTRHHGIVSFLLMIHQMKLLARPAIEANRGLLVKAEADNLFCLFDTTADAIGAAAEIVRRLNTVNVLLPEDRRLYASVGIGYGRILNVGDEDLYGDEVNLASKLGEDVAARGVVLLTEQAHAQLPDGRIPTREEVISVSGISLVYYVVEGLG